VAILDRDAAAAEGAARAIGDAGAAVSTHAADVTDEDSLERAFATVAQHHGGVDILSTAPASGYVIRPSTTRWKTGTKWSRST